MEGTETQRRWLQRATLYAISMTIAGGAVAVALAAAGAGLWAVWPDTSTPLASALGVAALGYAAHELGLVRLRVPGRDWQVPAPWVRDGFYRSAVVFGGTVGLGVVTRIPYASLPVLLAWLFVSGNVPAAAVVGAVYGGGRALSIYAGGSCTDTSKLVALNQRLQALTPAVHQVTGLALATFGAYLLAAPYF